MAVSKVELGNRALALLGEPQITSFDDNNQAAELLKLIYDGTRRTVLRDHLWNATTTRATLALDATAPAFGFANAFVLPTDFLRIVRVNDGREPYRIEQLRLLSDASSLELIYVSDIDDPTVYDSLLVDALVARLAADMAIPLAKDAEMENTMWRRYQQKLEDAKVADAQDGPSERFNAEAFIDPRTGNFEATGFRSVSSTVT